MELLAINLDHIDSFCSIKSKYEQGEHKAFLFLAEEKKKNSDLNIKNGVAKIDISGVLGNAWYYDTEYNTIIQKTIEAESRPDVKSIDFIIDSPGGLVSGVEEAARTIKSVTKPTKAIVKNIAASAAYWLASQTDEIIAMNESAQVGSIGVMAVFYDWSKWEEKNGIKEIKIISSKAPDKNPDIKTEKGMKKYQTEIDKLHDIFAKNVANGRNTTIEDVNENFGQGGVLFSEEAKKAGMIDFINLSIKDLTNNDNGVKAMADEKTFTQAELNAAIATAKAEGVKEGTSLERTRVEKHLTYLGSAKNESILENIKNGTAFSDSVEKYAEEKFAKTELKSRGDENPEPKEQAGPKGQEPKEKDPVQAHKDMFGR